MYLFPCCRWGQGHLIWKDGCTYNGQFEDDQMKGRGTFKSHPMNDYSSDTVEAHISIGKPSGQVSLQNSVLCDGWIENGVCNGTISNTQGTRQGEITLKFPQEKHNLKTG
jgi:hypothetical protein